MKVTQYIGIILLIIALWVFYINDDFFIEWAHGRKFSQLDPSQLIFPTVVLLTAVYFLTKKRKDHA